MGNLREVLNSDLRVTNCSGFNYNFDGFFFSRLIFQIWYFTNRMFKVLFPKARRKVPRFSHSWVSDATSRWTSVPGHLSISVSICIRRGLLQPLLNFRLCSDKFVPSVQSGIFSQLLWNSLGASFKIVAVKECEYHDICIGQLWYKALCQKG